MLANGSLALCDHLRNFALLLLALDLRNPFLPLARLSRLPLRALALPFFLALLLAFLLRLLLRLLGFQLRDCLLESLAPFIESILPKFHITVPLFLLRAQDVEKLRYARQVGFGAANLARCRFQRDRPWIGRDDFLDHHPRIELLVLRLLIDARQHQCKLLADEAASQHAF